jgi:hypothetical protein
MRARILATSCAILIALAAVAHGAMLPNRDGIQRFVELLRGYEFSGTRSEADNRRIQDLLRTGRSVINSQDSVNIFNSLNDKNRVAVIGKLVDLSTINAPDIRINASLILADVVENRTLCAVLDRLFEPELNENTRFNLLQIVRAVTNRLKNTEVKAWIAATLQANEKIVAGKGMEKTRAMLGDIAQALERKADLGPLRGYDPDAYRDCTALKNIRGLSAT